MQCGTVDCLPGSVGSVVKPCAEMDGGLWVHVLDDLGSNVPGANALKNGGDEQTTDVGGLARTARFGSEVILRRRASPPPSLPRLRRF